ncbi:hypothetical protein L210DRAFT_3482357 [Boletus edulis BED1]|uniref:Uncharacterized protein n=1 Tax=Boletus edulis BED1 TaxID=1328754 RepID=A0AAD4GDN4_BOLED|nr:hypothetical protein L210DRAFT_3482357 [Boletus edulis BED1]
MVSTVQFITLLVAPLAVLACEGECITGITKEYLKRYSPTIVDVFQNMADKIDAQIIPPENRRQDAISYFTPVIDAYNKVSYNSLEHAIFPSYFHGKCRDANGTVPAGCPNPDCPVVCGTPGSLVHFFPILTHIVFNQTSGQLTNMISPGTKVYQQVKKMVLADARKTQRRALSRAPRSAKIRAQGTTAAEKHFRTIMKDFPTMMLAACGGSNLAQCRWETYMKKFILQYP